MRAFRWPVPGRRAVTRPTRRVLAFGASAAVLLGVAVGVPVALGGQASASVVPVIITGFAAAPVDGPTITYGDATVAVSGRLVQYSSQTTGIPDEPIQIELGAGTAVGTSTTDADGNFSITVSLPTGGYLRAEFFGDTAQGYGATGTSGTLIPETKALTRVTLNAQPKLVPAGTKLTFTGKAEVQVAGTWQPLPGARVVLQLGSGQSLDPMGEAVTDASGAFTLPAVADTEFGQWLAAVEAPSYSLYGNSQSNLVMVGVIYQTRIAAVAVPATREAHQSFTITGTAQVWNDATWTGYPGMWVRYYYQVQGSSTWVYDAQTQTNASGGFSSIAFVKPGHFVWQVRVPAYVSADKFLPSASGTYKSFITDHTCVTGFYVSHSSGRTLVHARVQDWCANGQLSFGEVKGKVVNVYYHPAGSTTGRLIAQPHTDADGFVVYTIYSVLRGYFKVIFPAQGYYLASASKTVYAG
jgi:hypothetical protein